MSAKTNDFFNELLHLELPEDVAFAHPDDALTPEDEEALRVFLSAFDDSEDADTDPRLSPEADIDEQS